jgi:predicted AlkP superfamily pyrophosphatase or phosphodiesterase
MKLLPLILILFLVLSLLPSLPQNGHATDAPRLVVFISIDQMRADHLERYRQLYTAGFQKMLSQGTAFSNAGLNYAISSTGPGHATLSTGMYPWKSGIVSNNWTDRLTNRKVYCVEDSTAQPVDGEGGGRSPRLLRATTLGDWLQTASPRSKVISLSYKDRAAILLGGKQPTGAYWYDRETGHMVSSSYYFRTMPAWVNTFNAGGWVAHNTPPVWTKLKAEDVYAPYGPDTLAGEEPWDGNTFFPHIFNPRSLNTQVFDSPFGNSLLLDFSRAAIRGEELGQRGVTDLLCISLSATDNIGGSFGPNSHEMIDNLLRLDGALGEFITQLETAIGREHIMVVLSGDHGVMQLPEYQQQIERRAARRFDNGLMIDRVLKNLDSLLRLEYPTTARLIRKGSLNYGAAQQAGIPDSVLDQRVRAALQSVEGVADVYFRRELLDPATPPRPYLQSYRHSTRADRSPDFFIRDCENCLITSDLTGTSHGSPYPYDTTVPILFWGKAIPAQKVDRAVHTVDIAATLARMLDLKAPADLDGTALPEITP